MEKKNYFNLTKEFWNKHPCYGQDNFNSREKLRYNLEPWLLEIIAKISKNYSNICEVGCGSGTDGISFCKILPSNGKYVGIDDSDESIKLAKKATEEIKDNLKIMPTFKVGNAEFLDFEDNCFECIFSFGVIHHTENIQKAVNEIYRVLKPNGKAYIFIYRKWSPKVTIAKFLRLLQKILDKIFNTEKCLYKVFKKNIFEKFLGTMIVECFGVPILNWYSKNDIKIIFRNFNLDNLYPIAYNLPWFHSKKDALTKFGYHWAIEVTKN